MEFKKTKEALNVAVADLSQASAAIHQVHWYLRCNHFVDMHELMDEYRAVVEAQLDVVAERLITIDGAPVSTLEEFTKTTTIPSIDGDFDKKLDDHKRRVVEVFRGLVATFDKGIKAAQDEEDVVTEDMLIGFKGEIEKLIWQQQAELGKAPEIDA